VDRPAAAGVAQFCNVFVVLVPVDGLEREIGLLILDFERTGVEMDLDFLRSQASLRIESSPTKADIP
jgi:hypothetical protein